LAREAHHHGIRREHLRPFPANDAYMRDFDLQRDKRRVSK
jgi:hypothetical protein